MKCTQILCSRVIRRQDIVTAHNYLLSFCKTFSHLYGAEACTPNLHMHLHLKECLFDYGPSYSFWCFSFERYNGILGRYHTNNRSVGSQMMRKFIKEQHISSMEDTSLSPDLSELFLKMAAHSESTSSYRLSVQQYAHLASLKVVPLLPMPDFRYSSKQVIKLLPPVFEHVLKSDELKHIRALILQFHSYSTVQPFLQLCRRSSRVCVAGELFVSRLCKSDRSSCIAAYWPLPGSQSQLSVGHVQYYLEYNIPMGVSEKHTYILACVSWFKVIQTRTGLD